MPDQVDRLVTDWRRERPDIDVQPLGVLSRVVRLARHVAIARKEVFAEHGLDQGQFDVLAALRRAGRPHEMTPGDLMAEALVTSGTMTHRVDQMEAAGLVSRRADPADGRVVRVRLTPRGRDLVDAALASLVGRERKLLERLKTADQARLAGLLRHLLEPLDSDSR